MPIRRWTAFVSVLALAGPAAAPASAQEAPASRAAGKPALPDVAAAIRARLEQGGGVTVLEESSTRMPGGRTVDNVPYSAGYSVQQKGRLLLDTTGVAASDMRRRLNFGSVAKQIAKDNAARGDGYLRSLLPRMSSHRSISAKGWLYASGEFYRPSLPKGRSWARVKRNGGAAAAYGDQLVNVFEPATLKALITEGNRKGDGEMIASPDGTRRWELMYAGTISFERMFKLSPTFREALNGRLADADRGLQLNWAVIVGTDGLPIRVVSLWEVRQGPRFFSSTTTTVYSGWGAWKPIAPPSAGKVAATRGPAELPESDDIVDVLAARPAAR